MRTRSALLLMVLCSLLLTAGAQQTEAPALEYLIASHERIPQNQIGDFVVDYLMPRRGRLAVGLFDAAQQEVPLRTWGVDRADGLPHVFRWDGLVDRLPLMPGDYLFTFEVVNSGEPARSLPLTILPPAEPPALLPSGEGDYLPAGISDAAVWQAMQAPLAVADAGALTHVPIYAQPGRSRRVGEVHGQTAGLLVLEADVGGYAKVGAWATEDGAYVEGYIPRDRLKVVQPDPRYGLLLDKNAQTMTVYQEGRKLGTLPVSTGLITRNKLFRETRAGAFLTQDRIRSFDSEGFRYDYAIRIDGGNLIHQLGYRLRAGEQDFTEHLPLLGQKASHGCVRLPAEPSGEGLSALWLWQHLPRNTKVLVLDDPAARQMQMAQLFPTATPAPTQEATPVPTAPPSPTTVPPERTTITLTFSGDSIIGSEEKSRALPESFDSTVAEKGYAWPFSGLREWFESDDLTIINFEGTLQDSRGGRAAGKMHWFRGPEEFVQVLTEGSVELAGLANNHVLDYGYAGRRSTQGTLGEAGIPTFGYGELYVFEKDGVKVGFGGIRETTWKQDRKRPAREIAELKAQGAHYIVYTIHAGTEYQLNHNDLQKEMARGIIDTGADLVVGAHPHVVQGMERYQQGTVFYSLGNFVFGGNLHLTEFDALVLRATLHFRHQQLEKTDFTLIPVLTSGTLPSNDFRPIPAQGEDKARILQRIQEDSGELTIQEEMGF